MLNLFKVQIVPQFRYDLRVEYFMNELTMRNSHSWLLLNRFSLSLKKLNEIPTRSIKGFSLRLMELDKSVNKPQGPKTLKPQNAMNTCVNISLCLSVWCLRICSTIYLSVTISTSLLLSLSGFFWNWKHICIQFELWLSTFCCCCCCCCHGANAHCLLLLLLLFVAYVCTRRTLWGCFNMRLYGCSSKTRLEEMHSRKSDEPQRVSLSLCVSVCAC